MPARHSEKRVEVKLNRCILNVGIRQNWVISFTPQHPHTRRKSLWNTVFGNRRNSRVCLRVVMRGKSVPLPGIESRSTSPLLVRAFSESCCLPSSYLQKQQMGHPLSGKQYICFANLHSMNVAKESSRFQFECRPLNISSILHNRLFPCYKGPPRLIPAFPAARFRRY
jgi:hypothetical protein